MRVLLIKTSSMGDIIHTLPALTDAAHAIPGIEFDWLVEEPFSEIASWSPHVNNVIPINLRQWRKTLFSKTTRSSIKELWTTLRAHSYDKILDAQGLLKSAALSQIAKGERIGLDFHSAREGLASLFYQKKCTVNFYQHAVSRMRLFFNQALGYDMPTTAPDFGINRELFINPNVESAHSPYLVFLFGTTWASKKWPLEYWKKLARLGLEAGFDIKLSAHNRDELTWANTIKDNHDTISILSALSLTNMAKVLSRAHGVVAVDTGLGHLAAALGVKTVSIYGSTNPTYTGAIGPQSQHLAATFACAPCLNRTCHLKKLSEVTPACYETISPHQVMSALNAE